MSGDAGAESSKDSLCTEGDGSAAVCLDLYGEEEAQPCQTIANML